MRHTNQSPDLTSRGLSTTRTTASLSGFQAPRSGGMSMKCSATREALGLVGSSAGAAGWRVQAEAPAGFCAGVALMEAAVSGAWHSGRGAPLSVAAEASLRVLCVACMMEPHAAGGPSWERSVQLSARMLGECAK